MDNVSFSHPVDQQPRPSALTAPQAGRYGDLFRQPAYAPGHAPVEDSAEPAPRRKAGPANTRARASHGRRAHR